MEACILSDQYLEIERRMYKNAIKKMPGYESNDLAIRIFSAQHWESIKHKNHPVRLFDE